MSLNAALQQPRRKRKYVRADEDNQRVLKRKGRALKRAMEDAVIQAYLTDELREYSCPVLTMEEIIERTDMAADETLMALMFEHCHGYMKAALKSAINEGIPGVLVTREFCNDVPDDTYVATQDIDVLKSWIAGLSRAGKAAGILFVYEDDITASTMYLLAANSGVRVTNGLIKRNVATVEAAIIQNLPSFDVRNALVRKMRNLKLLPMLDEGSNDDD